MDTGEILEAGPDPADQAAMRAHLSQADMLIGHNIAGFDIPLLERTAPGGWSWPRRIYDTRVASKLLHFATLSRRTAIYRNAAGRSESAREARYPRHLMAPHKIHKLESWGYRLGYHKGSFLDEMGVQEEWSPELQAYCKRDVELNTKLFHWLTTNTAQPARYTREGRLAFPAWPVVPMEPVHTDSLVQYLLQLQEENGVGFDYTGAEELQQELEVKRAAKLGELRLMVQPFYMSQGEATPARTQHSRKAKPGEEGYRNVEAGCKLTRVKRIEFDPAKPTHVVDRLRKLYGWVPTEWTPGSRHSPPKPKTDSETLKGLPYPIIPALTEYLMLDQRLGQLVQGQKSWMKCARRYLLVPEKGIGESWRIHGRVNLPGARTHRMSHYAPNMNVPQARQPYGLEMRALFRPTRPGWVQVGIDAAGIEMRIMAHHLAHWDGGEFAKLVVEGDVHETWREATELFYREIQKNVTYSRIYGAREKRIGEYVLEDWRLAYREGLTTEPPPPPETAFELGVRAMRAMDARLPAFAHLVDACRVRYQERRYMTGLDGRVAAMDTEHGAVNDLCQMNACGVVMKWAKVEFWKMLEQAGLLHGVDYAWMLDVHDEWQLEARDEETGRRVGELGVMAIAAQTPRFNLQIQLDGAYKVGKTWADTH